MKSLQLFILASIFIGHFAASVEASSGVERSADAARDTTLARKASADDFEELFEAAYELYRQKKYEEALAACAKAARLNPKDYRAPALNGLIYLAQLKLKSASEEFAASISLWPENKPMYLFKARADNLRGEKQSALAAARKALEIDPNYAEAYVMIGDILKSDEKRRDEADAAYRSAIRLDPALPAWYERLGNAYLNDKDEKGAEEFFRKALELDPKLTAGRFDLGRLLVRQKRLTEARELWEGRKTDADNTFPNFITLLERAEKLQAATEALAQKPDDPDTLVRMGNAVMEGDSWVVDGRQEKALVYFRKALRLKPNFAAAQYGICKAYVQIADTYEDKNKNVDEELARLRKLDPKLAKEIEEYRKTYSGGLTVAPANLNQ